MATTGKVNSTLLSIYVGGTKINHSNDASFDFTHAVRDVTTKDSGGYQENLEGLRSFTFSASGFHAFDATYGPDEMDDVITGRTAATIRYSTEVSGDTYYEGSCYMTSLSCNSPGQEETATWSAEFTGTGTLTVGSVT